MGSKNRIAKHLLPIMVGEANSLGITTWVEPFVGGGNMIDKVPKSFKRIGYDLNDHTIQAMIGIRDHLDELPTSVSEQEYKDLKGTPPNPLTSWVRIACSYGGIFESKLAADKVGKRNYPQEAKRNAEKQSPNIQGVDFIQGSYSDLSFDNCIIYCDPPYKNTSGYKTGVFDHDKFYAWCKDQAKNNLVFISEYEMPDEFECVWEGEVKTNFASSRKRATHIATEKLYMITKLGEII